MHPQSRSWLPLALLLIAAEAAQAGELLMVYSIQRHGARNVLPKTATLKEKDAVGGPTLLPEGQRQAFDAGLAYRQRYLNASSCAGAPATCLGAVEEPGPEYGVVGSPDGQFNNYNVAVRSSSLDRAIMTARSFLDAVFPAINQPTATKYLPDGEQVVPVYSLPEDGDGALVRGYSACPAYDARLLTWYNSSEFAQKEADTAALRAQVAAAGPPGLDTSLRNWWNVYDSWNVYRTYGVGDPMPDISDDLFAQIQQLAYWLETAKMRSALTGSLLGGLQLGDLLAYLARAEAALASNAIEPSYYKLVHLSGHYNTQLGVLGALGTDEDPGAANVTWLTKIPSLAALMAFELHGDAAARPQELAVRLVMQDGPKADYATIPLPCAVPGDGAEALAGPGACTLDSFRQLAEPRSINGTAAWCGACENDSMSVCKLQRATAELQAVTAGDEGAGGGSSGLSGGAVAGIAIGCVAATLAACGVGFVMYRRRMLRQLEAARLVGVHQAGHA